MKFLPNDDSTQTRDKLTQGRKKIALLVHNALLISNFLQKPTKRFS